MGAGDRAYLASLSGGSSSRGASSGRSIDSMRVEIKGIDELLKMFKALGTDKERIKEITMFIRKAIKPVTDMQIANVRNSSTSGKGFKVYRNGKVYATTTKEQLAKSIAFFKKKSKDKFSTAYYSGPRLKGRYAKPEIGGWIGMWFEYGTKYSKTGKGKINIKAKPFTNVQNVATASKMALSSILNNESLAIGKTIKRFKKNY